MRGPLSTSMNADPESILVRKLRDAPRVHSYRYTEEVHQKLLHDLFLALACNKPEYLAYFFPKGSLELSDTTNWNLSVAQGALGGAEYSPAARGKPCGHIFKNGEATYRCKTCSHDDTCVLCVKCFEASDHTDHTVFVGISAGNSGCCDCGDTEAWKNRVMCAIHTVSPRYASSMSTTSSSPPSPHLPPDLVVAIRNTIARALDYVCDVISCSPEQLRLSKSKEAIEADEEASRLNLGSYGSEVDANPTEYALVLWNDEKHTIDEVEDQVARACKETRRFGRQRASETHNIGRSIVVYSSSLEELLRVSRIIEQIKITVTIRSARDIFREQMCATIIGWLGDISGCSVGGHNDILRETVCEELLGVWRVGSKAANIEIGKMGIDDHSVEEDISAAIARRRINMPIVFTDTVGDEEMDIDPVVGGEEDDEDDVDMVGSEISNFDHPPGQGDQTQLPTTRLEAITREPETQGNLDGLLRIPQTPGTRHARRPGPPPPPYWLEKPLGYLSRNRLPPHEDLRRRVRLDWLILFDLRLWKKARIGLRDLYISTVVAIPEFKRLLGLRFAGLYTILSQLYLVPDREPDHSIINLSLQILTTPSITAEVVRRGNFLTNQMAILYTFLTTRQVGHPQDVNTEATLSFDAGSLTNRRMFHFYQDMRYLFGSHYVRERLRTEERYTLQFLDLVALHQGICPNVRAVGEHLEYEVEAWISASLITREINRLARQFSEAFRWAGGSLDSDGLQRVIPLVAKYTAVNSLGWERFRFRQAEIKEKTLFKDLAGFEFDCDRWGSRPCYRVVDFAVDRQPVSFHHALHYTLSWLIEAGRNMPVWQLHRLLRLDWEDIRRESDPEIPEYDPEDIVMAIVDFPLRVCVWLSQMKAGMWVRNGFSLRHQMQTYKSVSQRDLTHNRDIFLLQTAMVTVNPSRMLATMIDRFNLLRWIQGHFETPAGYEETQYLDLAEDFLHLLIVIASDRLPLIPQQEEPEIQSLRLKRELVHILCFKPMQFSDLCNRLPDKMQDHEKFQEVLAEMTIFRAPDGLSDSGTFELKGEYLEQVDPYIMQFSRNQREEIEAAYCTRVARETGQLASEVVLEPKLKRINSGVFPGIASFTKTPIFAQIIYYSLAYTLQFKSYTSSIAESRVETFLHLCLHLCQLAVAEDMSVEGHEADDSFILHALQNKARGGVEMLEISPVSRQPITVNRTIATLLHQLSRLETFKACWPKINNVMRRMREKKPVAFNAAVTWRHDTGEKMDTDVGQINKEVEEEKKRKRIAVERQARIMAQMKQQQQNFMTSSGFDFGDVDLSDSEHEENELEPAKRRWKYPAGTCILCQEEMNDSRLYGTLSYISNSDILRQTPTLDPGYLYEVSVTPDSLDRSADEIRPFGVASMNRESVRKFAADGTEVITKRQGLGVGFPHGNVERGPVATGCSHIMHFGCFENYQDSTRRRHPHQIAREHPERLELKEFVCPLCKALGNAFLPIIWKPKEEALIGVLTPTIGFGRWVGEGIASTVGRVWGLAESDAQNKKSVTKYQEMFQAYGLSVLASPLAGKLQQLSMMRVDPHFPEVVVGRSGPSLATWMPGAAPRLPGAVPPTPVLPPAAPLPVAVPLVPAQTEVDELTKIYRRLRDTFLTNRIQSRYQPGADLRVSPVLTSADLTHYDSLARVLGFSITAVEIAQRGVGSETGSTLLDKISEQNLTHLRILSETISSYFSVGMLQGGEKNRAVLQFVDMQRRQMQQLLIGHDQVYLESARQEMLTKVPSLLAGDVFVFLAECSVCLVPALGLDIMHVIRLCYMGEILKTMITLCNTGAVEKLQEEWSRVGKRPNLQDTIAMPSPKQVELFEQFHRAFTQFCDRGNYWSQVGFSILRSLVIKYTAPFLRKVAILLHVRHGIVFPNTAFEKMDEPEYVRLSDALQFPSFDEILKSVLEMNEDGGRLRLMLSSWALQVTQQRKVLTVPHPSIFELVGLPLRYDTLMDEAMKRRCPNSGKDLVDPSVCLFCGEVFCSQAVCCAIRGKGGCNQHLEKCGKNVGLFINIRKCCILYLHNNHGSFAIAPYLDTHGETDWGLRRSNQLFLNQRRYDALLRSVWLGHGIPSFIARKLEAEVNNGGWETM